VFGSPERKADIMPPTAEMMKIILGFTYKILI